jgi:SAM-dependent methyltransferase
MKINDFCPICKLKTNIIKWTTQYCKNISSSICNECDIVFADQILDDGEFSDFYNKYNNDRDTEKKDLAIKRDICYQNDKKFINNNCDNRFKNILDIGCGNGMFLSLFDCKNKTGYDIDKNIIIDNKLKYNNTNFINNLNEINDDEQFDLIFFRGTFQYMRDLDNIKEFIDNKLDANGHLVILSLPNKNSPLAELQRENWGLYNPIEMFNIFSLTSIKKIFNNYKIVDIEFPYLETPYADEKNDIIKFNELITNNKQQKFPFWWSMMQIIFQK